jgi:hypothetical protein
VNALSSLSPECSALARAEALTLVSFCEATCTPSFCWQALQVRCVS